MKNEKLNNIENLIKNGCYVNNSLKLKLMTQIKIKSQINKI